MQYSRPAGAPASSYDDDGGDDVDNDDAGHRQGPVRAPAPPSGGQVADGAGRCPQISQITSLCDTNTILSYHLPFLLSSGTNYDDGGVYGNDNDDDANDEGQVADGAGRCS